MTRTEYLPGEWFAVVSERGAALLPASVDTGLTTLVWSALDAGGGFAGLLDILTGAFGSSLSSFPSFAIAAVDGDEIRIAVRGPLTVETTEPETELTLSISGDRVTTWNERVVPTGSTITIGVNGSTDIFDRLVIASGVVRSSQLVIGVTEGSHSDPAIRSEPTKPLPPLEGADTVSAPKSPERAHSEPSPVSELAADPELTMDSSQTLADTPDNAIRVVTPEPEIEIEIESNSYDELWGSTIATSVESAAVRPIVEDEPEQHAAAATATPVQPSDPLPAAAQAPPSSPVVGMISGVPLFGGTPVAAKPTLAAQLIPAGHDDHDGETISLAQLQQLQGSPPTVPVVPAAAHPVAGRIILSNGDEALLDRTIIIGRRPRASRVSGAEVPQLLAVPSPQQDISRSHVEIRIEGTHVLAQDLNTTNGTILRRTGDDPLRLHPGEATMLSNEDVLDLGEGITITFVGLA